MQGFPWGREVANMLNCFLRWRPVSGLAQNIFDSRCFFFVNQYSTDEKRLHVFQWVLPEFRSTSLHMKKMTTESLKRFFMAAYTFRQFDFMNQMFPTLETLLSPDDEFWVDMLRHTIFSNDRRSAKHLIESNVFNESKVLCSIKTHAPLITSEMMLTLLPLIENISTKLFLSNDSGEVLCFKLAASLRSNCLSSLLSYVGRNYNIRHVNEQDHLRRNILMWTVSDATSFELVLRQASDQGDLALLLCLNDSNGWSCLRHACHADNFDIVKLLIEDYNFDWEDDEDLEKESILDFCTKSQLTHITEYLRNIVQQQ